MAKCMQAGNPYTLMGDLNNFNTYAKFPDASLWGHDRNKSNALLLLIVLLDYPRNIPPLEY